jgi:hypothetical protein
MSASSAAGMNELEKFIVYASEGAKPVLYLKKDDKVQYLILDTTRCYT